MRLKNKRRKDGKFQFMSSVKRATNKQRTDATVSGNFNSRSREESGASDAEELPA